jgi:hypothetical protein
MRGLYTRSAPKKQRGTVSCISYNALTTSASVHACVAASGRVGPEAAEADISLPAEGLPDFFVSGGIEGAANRGFKCGARKASRGGRSALQISRMNRNHALEYQALHIQDAEPP